MTLFMYMYLQHFFYSNCIFSNIVTCKIIVVCIFVTVNVLFAFGLTMFNNDDLISCRMSPPLCIDVYCDHFS